ncbi:tetratricopeptide repeat protein [Bacteroides sp. ET489]|uniref:tetratricopeptide repeat protein n=1 Tax=Bacteroides sp. ET489 TaxID=3057126 RepID=UPI002670F73B|nr:tetratricopeptide repeat protein [Bacteroides sp. ET489]MDO3390429.1 tetratricopeptide repeat protein [Bacteroides sp. ET489]
MTKKLYLPLLVALVAVLTSCGSKMGELSSDYFTVTPQVLEAVGGKVPATINGKFPEKYFNKKAVVEVTPVLKWEGGEAKGQSAVFQGEKVEGNEQTIFYKMGGSYTMKTSFDYVPEMAKSELYLEFKATIGKKTVEIPAVKIADGVISTSEIVEQTLGSATPALGADAFQRVIKEKHDAQIMFLIQQANVRASELKTAKEFNEEVKNVSEAANKKISNIEISAYASPDGGYDLNKGLAENRQDNTAKVINKNLKKDKIEATVDTKYTAQDWEGFQELVSKSNIQDKELILRVLSMYQDPEQREQEIKNISSVYKTLADEVLPQLRRSRLTLNYEVIGKSDEEISKLAESDAKQLNLEELLYAATLTNDAAKKEAIYTKATQNFPNDYRAYNNLGKLAYQAGNLDKAENYFKKAASIKDAPEVNMNLGLIALNKGDKAAAESYLGKAAGAEELNEALGNLYIAQGQYDKAVNAFGDIKTNSAALAQILAKDYNKAKNTLAGVATPDAYTDYLMAVLGARTNNTSMVTSSLKNAVAKNPALAKKAASDLEFAKYFTNADFMNIIK